MPRRRLRLSPIKRDALSPITEERESGLSDLSKGHSRNGASLLQLSQHQALSQSALSHHDSLHSLPPMRLNRSVGSAPGGGYRDVITGGRDVISRDVSMDAADRDHTYEEITDNESCLGNITVSDVRQKMSTILVGRGQLQMSIYRNGDNMLTVHVVRGRKLDCDYRSPCRVSVRVSLIPETDRRTRCQTPVVSGTTNPIFDQKFSYELLEDDIHKRILVSAWDYDPETGSNDFLGCMSFGVHNIVDNDQEVSGWFYLLREKVGRRKHLRALDHRHSRSMTSQGHPQGHTQGQSQNNSTYGGAIDVDAYDEFEDRGQGRAGVWMDNHTVMIRRSARGYGFKVAGSDPVQVCGVEEGSAADLHGLKVNDFILAINGVNVTYSTPQMVAKIVKQCDQFIQLDVRRPKVIPQLLRATDQRELRLSDRHHGNRSSISYVSDSDDVRSDVMSERSFRRPRRHGRHGNTSLRGRHSRTMDFDVYDESQCDVTADMTSSVMVDASVLNGTGCHGDRSNMTADLTRKIKKRRSLSTLFSRADKENRTEKPKKAKKIARGSSLSSLSNLLAKLNRSLHH